MPGRFWFLISNFCFLLLEPSAAGFRLRYVTLNLFGVGADNGADKSACAIINVNLRNGADVVLLRYRCFPINDVNLAQRSLKITPCHLLPAWRERSTRAAPIRIKIDNSHVAECEMF